MNVSRGALATLLLLAAFVFFLLAALVAGGIWHTATAWFLASGLAAGVASKLVGGD